MAEPQLLTLPMFYNPMAHKISATGVTVLKEGKYHKRYHGCKDLIQLANGQFLTKKAYFTKFPNEVKKAAPKKSKAASPQVKRQSVPRTYKLDKRTICHRLNNYWRSMQGEKQLYFWTISFPKGTTDDAAHILMNKWLTRLRSESMVKSYLWVTERQQNGTIHFHMAVNNRMDVKRANRFMRSAIMTSIDQLQINWPRSAAAKYNGVDIAKNRKTKRVINFAKQKAGKALGNYLTKYVTKNNETFTHLAWHCSRDYSNIIVAFSITSSEFFKSGFQHLIASEALFESEYFQFFKWKDDTPKRFHKHIEIVNTVVRQHLEVLS